MPAPKTHVASMESVRVYLPGDKKMDPNEEPRIERDPMTSFEYFHVEMQATFNAWMTLSLDDRKKRTALFGSPILTDAKPILGRDQYKWTPARRHKVLNYIIWIESLHGNGSREVAAIAFNALFGKAKKGE